jgi:copper transport protein
VSGGAFADGLLIASRLLWYTGCLAVIGASAFRLFVSPSAGRTPAGPDRAAATTGMVAAAVLVAGALARVYAQTYAVFGLEEPVTMVLLVEVATGLPPWSTGWMQQFAAGAIALAALAAARSGRASAWILAHAAAMGAAASAPLTGHAVAQPDGYLLPVVLQGAHVLAAGVWIGGLFVLLVAGIPWAARNARPERCGLAPLVSAFSRLALCGAGLLALTGGATAFLYLNAVADLWGTSYGRVLLVKVAMASGVAAVGFVNWRRVRPRLGDGSSGLLRRTAALELAMAAAVLAATAVLVGLPQRGE